MRKINRIERLARREEKDIVKRIFFLSAVSIVLVVIVLTVGISSLGKLADFLDILFKNKGEGESENTFVQSPILDTLPQATNSARLKISGFSSDGDKIEVYRDGDKIGEAPVEGGRFAYEEITLSLGGNEITTKALNDKGITSDFSQAIHISFDKKEPSIVVDTPVEGQNIGGNNRIKVQGQTDGDSQVFANGFLANVGSDGKFDVTVPLNEGENTIDVKAVDEAGNTKTVSVKVTFHK